VCAAVAAGKEPVFASDGDAAQRAFGGVVVNGEVAVVDVTGEL